MSINFGDIVRRWGDDAPAVVDMGGDDGSERIIDYRRFNADCDALARGLARRGLKAGDRVGILSLNRYEYLVVLFGSPRAGIVPVPINIKFPAATIAFIIKDSGAKLVCCDGEHRAMAGDAAIDFDHDWADLLDFGPFSSAAVAGNDVALQIYTSGSTGRPKGVLLGHAGQIWNIEVLTRSRALARSSAMLIAAPLYHKNALVAAKIAFHAGGKAIVLPRFDARRYIDAIGRHRATSLSGVPTMYQLVLAEQDRLAATDVSSVTSMSVGSAPGSLALLAALRAAFPRAFVTGNYGLTEGGPVPFGQHPGGVPRPNGSIGYPLDGVECRLEPGPDEGVLWTRNPGVMLGYHNLPAETAKRLKDGWLDTQDVMRRDAAGFYYFVGRADDMFKCGGESVFPAEVESLLERHEAVLQAAVVPAPDALKGAIPIAFVVPRAGAAPDEEALKRYALAHGPAFLHPRRVVFLDALPLAGTNKIDRAALIARAKEFAR